MLQIQGPSKAGEQFWSKFKKETPAEEAPQPEKKTAKETPKDTTPEKSTPADTIEIKETPPRILTRAERELIEDSQLSPSEDDEHDEELMEYANGAPDDDGDDLDGESVTSSNHSPQDPPAPGAASVAATSLDGSVIDQMETQPVEGHEPTIEPVSCGDPGLAAREELAARSCAQPTPDRHVEVWGLQNNVKRQCWGLGCFVFFLKRMSLLSSLKGTSSQPSSSVLAVLWFGCDFFVFPCGPLMGKIYAHTCICGLSCTPCPCVN